MSGGIDLVLDDLDANVGPVMIDLRRLAAFAEFLTVDDLARLAFIMAPVGRAVIALALGDDRPPRPTPDDDAGSSATGVGVRRDT